MSDKNAAIIRIAVSPALCMVVNMEIDSVRGNVDVEAGHQHGGSFASGLLQVLFSKCLLAWWLHERLDTSN